MRALRIWLHSLTTRQRSKKADQQLGILLASIAGAINAGGFLAVGRYTSHMTGIVASVSDALVLHQTGFVIAGVLFVASFIAGAATSSIVINLARTRHYEGEFALALMLEAFLLMLFGLCTTHLLPLADMSITLTIALLCFIMGLQNAIITKISQSEIRTTHVTGICTDIGVELGRFLYRQTHDQAAFAFHPAKLRFNLLMLAAFCGGGIAGAWAFQQVGFVTTIPLAFLLVLIAIAPVWDDLHPVKPPTA